VQRECLKRGLILELGGRHGSVVRFLPPLVITAVEIDRVAEIFGRASLAQSPASNFFASRYVSTESALRVVRSPPLNDGEQQ
jgi:hypothetical protein